ncbi:MAG: cyclodeaminase/cyclohydrolase family protein [Firmicutes bacterium]|nr:cyclodeaminase/cyclohydrolase family protein [Bacillota bacterium]
MILCAEAMELMVEFQKKGSRLALSDAGCGAAMCKAAMESAKLNVYINLKLMKDEEKVRQYQAKMDEAFIRGMALADQVYREVEEELRP